MSQNADSQYYLRCFKRLLKMLVSVGNWKIGLPQLLNRSPGGIVLKMSVGLFLFFQTGVALQNRSKTLFTEIESLVNSLNLVFYESYTVFKLKAY